MAWCGSDTYGASAGQPLHPLTVLSSHGPTRFAKVVFTNPNRPLAKGEGHVIVPLDPGWEKWRVSRIRSTAEQLIWVELREERGAPIAYMTDTAGGALHNLDTLGDLELIPRRVAANVTLRAVLEHERLPHTVLPSADQERMLRTLDGIDRVLEEKQSFLDALDAVHASYGLPGAGGLLAALDDAVDERAQAIGAIDTLLGRLVPTPEPEPGPGETAPKKLSAKDKPPWNPLF